MAGLSVDEILQDVFCKLAVAVDEGRFGTEQVAEVLTGVGEAVANPIAHSLAGEIVKVGQRLLQPATTGERAEVELDVLDRMMAALRFSLEIPVPEKPETTFSEGLVQRFEEATTSPASGAGELSRAHLDAGLVTDFLAQHQVTIDDIETVVLSVEDAPDEESIGLLKRLLHTLKGDSGLVGLSHIEHRVHELETALSSGVDCIDQLLVFIDWMRQQLQDVGALLGGQGPALTASAAEVEFDTNPIEPTAQPADEGAAEPDPDAPSYEQPSQLSGDPEMTADFISESTDLMEEVESLLLQLESDRKDAESLNAVFRAFHTIKGLASFLELPHIRDLAHETESLLVAARSEKLVLEGPAFEATLSAFDVMKTMIADCKAAVEGDGVVPGYPKLAPLLAWIVDAKNGDASAARPSSESVGGAKAASVAASSERTSEPASADAPPAKASSEAVRAVGATIQETIRVDPRRLDRLVDAIGELVIAESMVAQSIEAHHGAAPDVSSLLGHMNKTTRELQEMAMSLRMVPLRSTFRRMARLARDVAKKLGKRIEFRSFGDDAELDKTMVDAIGDPLMHMIRNAVDHGLEGDVEDRRTAGKSDVGQLSIRAYHEGGGIYIEVSDDGRGLDRDAILSKAIDRGLVREGESLTDEEALQLILEPGFSTAKTVSEVSGRGVGLDVVKRNIESLRGHVDVRSQKGSGTTFVIRLPLTLAVIEGMVVRVAKQRFVIPTLDIVRIIQPSEDALSAVFDRGRMLKVGGDLMPLFHILDVLGLRKKAEEWTGAVVVVAVSGKRVALAVDAIIGQQQIVIKNLGDGIAESAGFSGGAIMPDGRVSLILDTSGVVDLALRHHAEGTPTGVLTSV